MAEANTHKILSERKKSAKAAGSNSVNAGKARPPRRKTDLKPSDQATKLTAASAAARKPTGKRASRKEAIIALLSRKGGASLNEMQAATGWQAHSLRGFLSGTISKKLGMTLTSSADTSGVRRYAIKP